MTNLPDPLSDRPIHHAAAQTHVDAVQQIAAPYNEAANDSAEESDPKPLWMVVFATGCLFTILALLVMSG